MTMAATSRAFDAQPSNATAKLVLIAMSDFTDEYDTVSMAPAGSKASATYYEYLSTFAMCPKDQVDHFINQLVAEGFLIKAEDGQAFTIAGRSQ